MEQLKNLLPTMVSRSCDNSDARPFEEKLWNGKMMKLDTLMKPTV